MTERSDKAEHQRRESPAQRLDRNTIELLNELRVAPAVHHRLLFRHGEKSYLLRLANHLAIAGMLCLALGFVGILVLLSDVVLGGAAPVVVGALATLFVGGLWFALPLVRRDQE